MPMSHELLLFPIILWDRIYFYGWAWQYIFVAKEYMFATALEKSEAATEMYFDISDVFYFNAPRVSLHNILATIDITK